MVRLVLSMCVQDLQCPADVFDAGKKRLLLKKGAALTDRAKELLKKSHIDCIEFPMPFEKTAPPPYTFSEKTESAIFEIARDTFIGFGKRSTKNPLEIRKEVYEALAQAASEFERHYRLEHPILDTPPKRSPKSVLHLRTVGRLQDYLYEHAKNTALTCVALAHDYFNKSNQLLAEIHKVALAGLFADIGMMHVPERIRNGQGELAEKDWEIIQKHPETSFQFVESMFRQENFVTATIVLQHHERCGGSGYPAKLRAHQMEPHACLLAAADSYQSMVSKRYFREPCNPAGAIVTLNQEAGKNRKYDENAVKSLNFRIAPYPVGSVAKFAEKKLVQVVSLKAPLTEFERIRLLTKPSKADVYNMPETVHAFSTQKAPGELKQVKIAEHLDKLGAVLDTFDLLTLYGYTSKKSS